MERGDVKGNQNKPKSRLENMGIWVNFIMISVFYEMRLFFGSHNHENMSHRVWLPFYE
jgi:hypothetical protein